MSAQTKRVRQQVKDLMVPAVKTNEQRLEDEVRHALAWTIPNYIAKLVGLRPDEGTCARERMELSLLHVHSTHLKEILACVEDFDRTNNTLIHGNPGNDKEPT